MASDCMISVIIPSYKQKHVIFDALQSVLNQQTELAYEIIVVESTGDDTATLIRRKFPQIKVIELTERAFPGKARNYAIREAKGELLVFTDTDCIVDKNWLGELWAAFQRGYKIIGGMVRNGTPRSIFGTVDYLLEFADLITPHETTEKTHFGTCNVAFDRTVFERHGLFIDQVKGSDSLYTRMARENGETLLHQPSAIIWHRNRTKFKKILRNQYELGYGAAFNRFKYNLQGKIFITLPFLIPAMPFIRSLAIGWRLLKNSKPDFLKFVFLQPFILAGLFNHARGFYHGRTKALRQESIK